MIFVVGLYWPQITAVVLRERAAFGRLFGRRAAHDGAVTMATSAERRPSCSFIS